LLLVAGCWLLVAGCWLPAPKADAFAKTHKMAMQKIRPTRLGGFSGAKAYI
jgi:hypothetical protein